MNSIEMTKVNSTFMLRGNPGSFKTLLSWCKKHPCCPNHRSIIEKPNIKKALRC
jgi:hypothetical protein